MANPLLDRRPPAELADSSQLVEFKGVLSDLPRLTEIVRAELESAGEMQDEPQWQAGRVDIKLRFGWIDPQRTFPLVEGAAAAAISTVCQRCLEVFPLDLQADLKLLLVQPEGSQPSTTAADMHEVWELEEAVVRPLDLVEEALILSIPLAPSHGEDADCGTMGTAEWTAPGEKTRPFADLKAQLAGKD